MIKIIGDSNKVEIAMAIQDYNNAQIYAYGKYFHFLKIVIM